MTKKETITRIYVACLSSYNNGKLHGAWIDANQETETITADVQKMLAHLQCPMLKNGPFMTRKYILVTYFKTPNEPFGQASRIQRLADKLTTTNTLLQQFVDKANPMT